MYLRDLECFLAVADELHFGRAADRLYVSQAMVSQSVRRLERQLGGALFDRTTRNVTFTALGAEFEGLARIALEAVITAYRTGQRIARERPEVFVLAYSRDSAGDLLDLVRRAPTSAVELRNMPTPAQVTALRQRRVHAGLGWETPGSETIETAVVTRTDFVALVPEGHPLAVEGDVTVAELVTSPVVGWPRALSPELTALFTGSVDPTGKWSFALTGTSFDDIAAHVLAGRGVGVFPRSQLSGRSVEGLRFVALSDGPVARELLAWRTDERHPILATVRELLCPAEDS
jgi:DNA-binding transcriptional LysR family regulator